MDIIRVSATSRASGVAGAIAGKARNREEIVLQAIGAAAVNQAVKAVVIANVYLARDRLALSCVPSFVLTEIDGGKTAVRFDVGVGRV